MTETPRPSTLLRLPPGNSADRDRRGARLAVWTLLLGLLWQAQAQAFFCFNIGGHSRSRDYPAPPPMMLAPPIVGSYPIVAPPRSEVWTAPPAQEPPAAPEIIEWTVIDGSSLRTDQYRFRPVAHRPAPQSPAAPIESPPL